MKAKPSDSDQARAAAKHVVLGARQPTRHGDQRRAGRNSAAIPWRLLRAVIAFPILSALCGQAAHAAGEEAPAPAKARPLILVHYMPWYEAKPFSDTWGWHWRMDRFDPERRDAGGRREIASHYQPLIGPYDSADPDVLEYHALLMRVAGVDGVVADWYGNEDVNDYAMIHRRTAALFETLGRRGLRFAVCYEDRALRATAERQRLTPAQAVERGRAHLRFCDGTWFADPAYLSCGGKPLLLVFGPEYLKAPEQWAAMFAGLRHAPAFFTLHERRDPAVGSFAWPPMWAAGDDAVLDGKELDAYLDAFHGRDGVKIAGAFPGFHDVYAEAGTQPSHGRLDAAGGETLRRTLARAVGSGSPFVQIATWNDWGEGTCVEPAREYGYARLETIQAARRELGGEPFRYRAADLRLPLRVYELRKRLALAGADRDVLDGAVDVLFAGNVAEAATRLVAIEKAHAPAEGAR